MEQQLNLILGFLMLRQSEKKIDIKVIHEQLFLKSITLTTVKELTSQLSNDEHIALSKDQHITLTDKALQFIQQGGYGNPVSEEDSKAQNSPNSGSTLFMSYCWSEGDSAERIYMDLSQVNIRIIKDNHRLKYKDSLSQFMSSIRDCDFAILLISDAYLKSKNCMTEVLELLKEKDYFKKVLPITMGDANIYKTADRLNYVKYWEQQCSELTAQLNGINPVNSVEAIRDLKTMTTISQQIDSFLSELTDILHISLSELQKSGYEQLLEKMNFGDVAFMAALLGIARTKNIERREIMLDDYVRKGFPLNSYFYSMKASTNASARKFEQARINFEEAIRQNPNNAEAYNNLGLLYNDVFKDYAKAIACFRAADNLHPQFTIAKLNLAYVLARNEATYPEAVQINRDIIEYDPEEPKPYNNLANYLKIDFKNNFQECERLFLKAIDLDPNYVEPYIGYANLLKLVKRTEEGNQWYRKARKKDKTKYYRAVIDAALKSVKG